METDLNNLKQRKHISMALLQTLIKVKFHIQRFEKGLRHKVMCKKCIKMETFCIFSLTF